ncbi:uncharacterized protein [Asterias amurensis]|uniref:uncharacterized protein n=1 Tax=Asterias amurensis TaxID=7602 RepID=UPI003AB7B928
MKERHGETIELLTTGRPAETSTTGVDHEDNSKRNEHRKLNMPVVVIMITGKVVGGGLLLVPIALSNMGWYGFIFLFLCCVTSAFTGVLLSRSWLVLMRWYPDEYLDEINRHPYPSIGYVAFGDAGRRVTAILTAIYGFGFTVASYLLVADVVQLIFVKLLHVQVSMCALIATAVLSAAPLLWFGSPKDMIIVCIVSGSTSVLGYLSLGIGSLLDIGAYPDTVHAKPTVFSVLGSLGLIMTAFGGQFVIPTIQHDMKNPEDMPISAIMGYCGIGVIYATLGLVSCLVYGDLFEVVGSDSIIDLITTESFQFIAIVCISIHMLIAGVLLNNPLFQDLENYLDIPYTITWKRILLRSVFSILVVCVALSVPSFSSYLAVVGGAIAALVNGILPCVVYVRLASMEAPAGKKPEGPLKWYFTLAILTVIVLSTCGGLVSTVTGITNLINNENNSTLPCYIQFH